MTSGHNKGPIGPLEPDTPPPAVPILKRAPIGEGPMHTVAPGQRDYTWDDWLNWAAVTRPVPVLNRKQATKYICEELDYPIGPTVLSQQMYLKGGGPPFVVIGRDAFYKHEDLRRWVEEDRARGRHSTAPKYLPLHAKRRCPRGYEHLLADPRIPVKLLLAAWGGKPPPPEHKECPWVKHEKCAKYPRALCNLIHLPLDPALFAAYEKRGIIYALRTKRPDALAIEAYVRDWIEGRGGPRQ